MDSGLLGDRGARAQLHVVEELKHDLEHAQIHNHNIMAPIAQEVIHHLKTATHITVQVSFSLVQNRQIYFS